MSFKDGSDRSVEIAAIVMGVGGLYVSSSITGVITLTYPERIDKLVEDRKVKERCKK